ncbi:MAG: hypothetical protein KJ579_02860 [Verrucomicrobia bacterium]|nr:hypothetical protein [Verrucomicrobiota bacterium]
MKTVMGIGLAALVAGMAFASNPPPTFDRYQPILDRKPFGDVVVATSAESNSAAAIVVGPGGEALGLRACSLIVVDGIGPRAGLVEVKTSKSYFLTPGETQDGIKLVSADYATEEIVIQRGSEMAVLRLKEAGTSEKKTAGASTIATATRLSFDERRKAFERQRTPPPTPPATPPAPRLQGAELEKHLQQYQMEVIRQGMPPLPIPLTPEMDKQLVQEGVLPTQVHVGAQGGASGQIIIQVQQQP